MPMPTPRTTTITTHTTVELRCERRGGATRAVSLAAAGLLRARLLAPRDDVLRIALVQTAASLLAGDRLAITVDLGPGARAQLVEVAGLTAHDARGGAPARIHVTATLQEGARLDWETQPFVLADGSIVERTTRIDLAAGAMALTRDRLVLGRAGEGPGRLHTALTVRHAGRELHVEELDTADRGLLRSPVVLGGAKVLDTLALLGARAPGDGALQLAGAGSLLVTPAASQAAAERRAAPVADAWRTVLFDADHGPDPRVDAPRLDLVPH